MQLTTKTYSFLKLVLDKAYDLLYIGYSFRNGFNSNAIINHCSTCQSAKNAFGFP